MQITINNIKYLDKYNSRAKLLDTIIPKEGQTIDYMPQAVIDNQNYQLSNRNNAGSYILPTDKEKVYLNFIPMKIHVSDTSIRDYVGNQFEYFVSETIIPPDLFTLPDGQIFRCTTSNSLPKPASQYTYYVMDGEAAKQIPNYKTLEVMLAERGQTLISVRVLTEKQCQDITKAGFVGDKSSSWKPEFEDQSTLEKLNELTNNAKTGQGIADDAKSAAQTQIDAVKAQAAASAAQAAAAQAQSVADAAAANAAIAQAQADQAAAQQTKAQLDLQLAQLNNT